MNKTQWYFFRQRLIGLMIVLSFLLFAIFTGEGTIGVLLVPMGIYLMLTKKMIIMDKYFFEREEEKLKKMQKRP